MESPLTDVQCYNRNQSGLRVLTQEWFLWIVAHQDEHIQQAAMGGASMTAALPVIE